MPLHIEKVSHSYDAVEALKDIDLDIADGETVVLALERRGLGAAECRERVVAAEMIGAHHGIGASC